MQNRILRPVICIKNVGAATAYVRKYRMAGWDRGAFMGVSHRAARFQKSIRIFLLFQGLIALRFLNEILRLIAR